MHACIQQFSSVLLTNLVVRGGLGGGGGGNVRGDTHSCMHTYIHIRHKSEHRIQPFTYGK